MICVNKLSVEVAQWRSQRATKGEAVVLDRQNVENSGKKGAAGGISTFNKPHVMKICIVAGRGN